MCKKVGDKERRQDNHSVYVHKICRSHAHDIIIIHYHQISVEIEIGWPKTFDKKRGQVIASVLLRKQKKRKTAQNLAEETETSKWKFQQKWGSMRKNKKKPKKIRKGEKIDNDRITRPYGYYKRHKQQN